MSGPGGSDYDDSWRPPAKATGGGGGGGGGGGTDPCDVDETTVLNSPDRIVLAGLSAGSVLVVELDPGPPRRLLAKTGTGTVAGSITSPAMMRIINCIATQSVNYYAEVLSVRGAACTVRIQRQ